MSGEPHAAIVEEVREPTVRLWSPIALLALVGGAAVTAGVFLPWAEATRVTLRTQDFLEGLASGFGLDPSAFPVTGDIQTVTGAVGGVSVTGRADLLGIGAAVAGFAAIVGAVLALGMPDPRMRRIGGVTAGVAGIAVILFAGSAWADTGGLVLKELVAQVRSAADQQLEALIPGIPFRGLITGPLLDRVESSLVAAVEVEAGPGPGCSFLSGVASQRSSAGSPSSFERCRSRRPRVRGRCSRPWRRWTRPTARISSTCSPHPRRRERKP